MLFLHTDNIMTFNEFNQRKGALKTVRLIKSLYGTVEMLCTMYLLK